MKRALLNALIQSRMDKAPTVLATEIESGAQSLIVNGVEVEGTLVLTPALLEAAETALRLDKASLVDGVFFQVFNPPLRMIIIGAVHIAQALAPMAHLADYEVTVIDPRGAWANEDRFPGISVLQDWPEEALDAMAPDRQSAIVALTHDPKLDDPALSVALASDAFYIGALGSRKTAAARADRLRETGISDDALSRIDGPIGLDIGAVSPAEIAIAIMGKVTLSLRGSKAGRSEKEQAARS